MADRLRAFNTFRYLYDKTSAYLRLKRFVSRYCWGGEEDGERDAIYAGKARQSYEVGKLNDLVGEVASELDIPLVDLHATFADHYAPTSNPSSLPTTGIGTSWRTVSSVRPSRASVCAILAFRRHRC